MKGAHSSHCPIFSKYASLLCFALPFPSTSTFILSLTHLFLQEQDKHGSEVVFVVFLWPLVLQALQSSLTWSYLYFSFLPLSFLFLSLSLCVAWTSFPCRGLMVCSMMNITVFYLYLRWIWCCDTIRNPCISMLSVCVASLILLISSFTGRRRGWSWGGRFELQTLCQCFAWCESLLHFNAWSGYLKHWFTFVQKLLLLFFHKVVVSSGHHFETVTLVWFWPMIISLKMAEHYGIFFFFFVLVGCYSEKNTSWHFLPRCSCLFVLLHYEHFF